MWAASNNPITFRTALLQFPSAKLIVPSRDHRLYMIDGYLEDWWIVATATYEYSPVIRMSCQDGTGLLIQDVAIDCQGRGNNDNLFQTVCHSRKGMFAFYAIRKVVVLLGFRGYRDRINLTNELRGIHKPALAIGFTWPRFEDVDQALGEPQGW